MRVKHGEQAFATGNMSTVDLPNMNSAYCSADCVQCNHAKAPIDFLKTSLIFVFPALGGLLFGMFAVMNPNIAPTVPLIRNFLLASSPELTY